MLAAPQASDHDVGRDSARSRRSCSTTTSVTAVPERVGLELDRLRVRQQGDVRMLERGPHAEHLGVGLRVHRQGKPSQLAQRTQAL